MLRRKLLSKKILIVAAMVLFITILLLNRFEPPVPTNELENAYFSTFKQHFYNFGHIIQPNVCREKAYELVIVITSYVGNVNLRSAHRQAMPQQYLSRLNVTRIFSLAHIPTSDKFITQAAINNENLRFGDILQGGFIENYRNLTFKHIMGLNWTNTHCKTKYIIKADDDTVFVMEKILELISKSIYRNNDKLLLGYVLKNNVPKRLKENKWYVSYKEYADRVYPPYLSGWFYITTPKIVSMLMRAASYRSYFWIDDVFITGILTMDLGLTLQNFKDENITLVHTEQVKCCLRDMKRGIICKYFLGPNGGVENMIYDFNEAWKVCATGKCRLKPNYDVEKDCVLDNQEVFLRKGRVNVKNMQL